MIRLLLAAIVALAALSPFQAGARERLTIGLSQFPPTFHPSIDSSMAKSYILGFARVPMTVFDPDWKLVCLACETLPTLENGGAVHETSAQGKPGLAVTYILREGLAWGDGTPVTTDDVLFTWEMGRHPKSGVTSGELFRRILSIDTGADKRTFTLHLDRVEFQYNAINDFDLLPAHLEKPVFEADPEAYKTRTLYQTDPANPGLYNGPYRIAEVARGSHVVLVRNDTWTGPKPEFDTIVVSVVENTAALEAHLLSGQVDMIAGELGLPIDQAMAFEKRHGARFRIITKPSLVYEHLDLNLDHPPLHDVRVRRALLYAVDRDILVAALFEGRQPVATSNVSPLDPNHAEDLPAYPYDPAKAAALLDEAGWPLGSGGLRRNAAGEALTVTLMTTAGNKTREAVEQVIQSQWQALGIQAPIRNEPPRVFFGETTTQRKVPGASMYAWISSPDNLPQTTLHSTMIPTEDNNWSGQNYPGYANPEMDRLLDAAEVELDDTKRRALWADIQRLYMTDLPVLPLYFRANVFVLPQWLTGLRPTGHQYPSSLWVTDWRSH